MGFFSRLFSRGFDEPKTMPNQKLLAAIAGQADWLEKMSAAPYESQKSPSIVELAIKRKTYMAHLCLEVISRGSTGSVYPGASKTLNPFSELIEYANELEATGYSRENAAIHAVKENLFLANGVVYTANWET